MSGIEALAAIGLAGNVVQFADFASQLVKAGRELYKSANSTTVKNEELELLARHLRDLAKAENLRRLAERTRHSHVSRSGGVALVPIGDLWEELSQQCIGVADDLIELLQTFKTDRSFMCQFRLFH